jgi:histidine phosphotransfer protein HptB
MTAIVDETSLLMLREVQEPGAPDIVEETIAIFLADAEQRLALLREAVAAPDALEVRRLAHTVRGACLVLGVGRLAKACETLETMGADDRMAEAPAALARVAEEFLAAREALRRIAVRGAAA